MAPINGLFLRETLGPRDGGRICMLPALPAKRNMAQCKVLLELGSTALSTF